MELSILAGIVAVGVAVAVMLWVSKLSRRGDLNEKMTSHEAKIMAGATLERPDERPMFEKTFGQKKTLASVSHETSLSWAEIGKAIKGGQVKKLWPLFFILLVIVFVAAAFLLL